jgi:hypothetical protein
MYLLCTDVGPVHPTDFARSRRRPRPEAAPAAAIGPAAAAGGPPAGEAERVLRRVERNLTMLTRTVPMAEIEDLLPSMQPHVVGVPRTWVQLFGIWKTSSFTMAGPTGPVLSLGWTTYVPRALFVYF